jgi:chromosome segregation ATPase
MLGEEVENPKCTFRGVEAVLEDRIKELNRKLLEYSRFSEKEQNGYDNIGNEIEEEFKKIDEENHVKIKSKLEELNDKLNEARSENLLYQKQLTTLKKERTDLMSQIMTLNGRLDDLEKVLGINLAPKKVKKKSNLI